MIPMLLIPPVLFSSAPTLYDSNSSSPHMPNWFSWETVTTVVFIFNRALTRSVAWYGYKPPMHFFCMCWLCCACQGHRRVSSGTSRAPRHTGYTTRTPRHPHLVRRGVSERGNAWEWDWSEPEVSPSSEGSEPFHVEFMTMSTDHEASVTCREAKQRHVHLHTSAFTKTPSI